MHNLWRLVILRSASNHQGGFTLIFLRNIKQVNIVLKQRTEPLAGLSPQGCTAVPHLRV